MSGARYVERSVAAAALGVALFNRPLIDAFDGGAERPLSLFLYLFGAWALVILLLATATRRRRSADPDPPDAAPAPAARPRAPELPPTT